ncbi:hypothetical protein V6N12_058052 [Hibiscus sabdariffa]|uniref:Uncharacterized protein n=1 Tax=Hibiscus sabdariffa TaxID=183260 RepID=A0ABR2BDH0_9ROSI
MPTSLNQTVDCTRLVLINVIMTGYRFNVGEVIAQEITAACQNDKGILAFPCIISALCRRAVVPTQPGDKYTAEKAGWSRKEYMRKMDVADAAPIRVVMPTPLTSPAHSPAVAPEEAGPSAPATAHSPPAAIPQSTPDSPLGSAPSTPLSPPPAQSEEAASLHILQLRSHLQRIEARQLHFQEETKVFQQSLIKFLCFQFPAAATFFSAQPEATHQAGFSAATQPQPSANPSTKAGETEEVHLSSDDESNIFDWQSPREHRIPFDPTSQQAQAPESSTARLKKNLAPTDVPTLHPAPTMPDNSTQRKGKAPAGRIVSKTTPSSLDDEEQPAPRPAKRQRRYHIITVDSDDDSSAAVPVDNPEKSADPSLSFTI